MRTYVNFRSFDKKGHRLGIFAEEKEGNILHITVIPCSKDDQFSKKEGRRLFEEIKNGGKVYHYEYEIPFITHPKNEFLVHCHYHFYTRLAQWKQKGFYYRNGEQIDKVITLWSKENF